MELDKINPYVLKVMPSAMRKFDHDISADPKIIKLTLGEPNFNVPEHIKQQQLMRLTITNLIIHTIGAISR